MRRGIVSSGLLLVLSAGTVIAGGTPNGPDVIVSTIGTSLDENGIIGGIGAYSMTTVSCNLGEADAIWIDSGALDTEHPVIGQNMYRLKDGRFEQIGQAWLKHGFCAADVCSCGSPCEVNGSCDWLGTHATDTYGAGLNASQPGMGPKSEVNPWTGDFPYPYILNWSQSGNAIFKRLQIVQTDLDPSLNAGALYFGESQYICTDEVEMNRYNNVSHRSVVVGGQTGSGQWMLSFSGATVVQKPAITAWAAADPTVTLVDVDVPNDGRFIVGYKVTEITGAEGSQWDYEYAVYNMNSDRSAGAISLPVDDAVGVTNIGFHDVPYHSGEPYSGTDWGSTRNAGTLRWSTEAYVINTNANAVRWGTIYNYRFRADQPPTPGQMTITLFKPGTPTAVFANVMVPSAPPPPACAGDVDGDGDTDSFDLNIILTDFGCASSCAGDVDGDGDTDSVDLNILLTDFGCIP